jgi:hypothetical protein
MVKDLPEYRTHIFDGDQPVGRSKEEVPTKWRATIDNSLAVTNVVFRATVYGQGILILYIRHLYAPANLQFTDEELG